MKNNQKTRNNLFEFWPTVLKTYLQYKGYRESDHDLNLILIGDVYRLPLLVEEKYKIDFFEDLSEHIKSSTKDFERPLNADILREYHEIYANSSYMFHKSVEEIQIFRDYCKNTEKVKMKPAIIDRWKVISCLLFAGIIGIILYFQEKLDTNKKQPTAQRDTIKNVKPISKETSEMDSTSPYFGIKYDANPMETGLWYSYNSSNGKKISKNIETNKKNKAEPYDEIKWFVSKMSNGLTKIERRFSSGQIGTKSLGYAEEIEGLIYLHLNTFNNAYKLIARREYVCKYYGDNSSDNPRLQTKEKILDCLGTIYNTDKHGKIELSYTGRELFMYKKPINKQEFYSIKVRGGLRIDSLPKDINPLFQNKPDSLMFLEIY